MLNEESITSRLKAMRKPNDSLGLWPENCAGSKSALVIFIGPSPGGKKEVKRREINLLQNKPLWNEPYFEPLGWSRGFRVSFRPIVEEIFGRQYQEAAKLIARFNMDWLQNPESQDVASRYMWEGCSYILPILHECRPEIVIPMDEKTYGVLQIALYNDRFEILPAKIGKIKIKISDKEGKARQHRNIMGFRAKKEVESFLVIKSPQHPARVYDNEYAKRIGETIKFAAEQMWKDEDINIDI